MTTNDQNATEWRARILNAYPDGTLIRATGTYISGGAFTDCWARPVPRNITGAGPRLWDVLVFGTTLPASLTTADLITAAELLFTEPEDAPIVANADVRIRAQRDEGDEGEAS